MLNEYGLFIHNMHYLSFAYNTNIFKEIQLKKKKNQQLLTIQSTFYENYNKTF